MQFFAPTIKRNNPLHSTNAKEKRACPQNSDMFLPAYSINRMNTFYPAPRQPKNMCHGYVVLGMIIETQIKDRPRRKQSNHMCAQAHPKTLSPLDNEYRIISIAPWDSLTNTLQH